VRSVCLCASACPVNVNTTDATAGATALLLPAQCVSCVSRLPPVSFYRKKHRVKRHRGSRDTVTMVVNQFRRGPRAYITESKVGTAPQLY